MLLNMVMFKVTICDFGKMNINMTDKIENKESSELITKSDQLVGVDNIESLIKIIRGQQVMLDRDLATLYGVETKRLNEQVKRNIKRFPEDFMFQLTKDECLRSQIATLNEGRGQHLKYMPYVFTENGVAMLSSVLRSDTAIEVNIRIMRAFTSMRHFMVNNASVFSRLETIEYHQLEMQQHQQETDKRIDEVFRRLDEGNAKPKQGVFYNGQIYDAYTFVSGLIKSAKRRIILIDNYVDETVLTLLDKRDNNVSAIIYTQQISRQFQLDIDRHNAQYALWCSDAWGVWGLHAKFVIYISAFSSFISSAVSPVISMIDASSIPFASIFLAISRLRWDMPSSMPSALPFSIPSSIPF